MVPTVEARVESLGVTSDQLPNDNFKRWMNVGHIARAPFLVKLLDEQVVYHSENGEAGATVIIRQFIKGHFDSFKSPLASKWRKHYGWQGEESIREFTRYNLPMPDGTFETRTREIDVSERNYRFD